MSYGKLSRDQLPPMPASPGVPTRAIVTAGAARGGLPELAKSQRHLTPPAFAEWLVELARRAR